MITAHHPQSILSQLAEPKAEGHGRLPQVAFQAPRRLELCFLHHVGGIDARADFRVEAQFDQLPQVWPMPGEELIQG
jgi:hypothetical protein